MARREYKGAATPTTITSTITNSASSLTISDATNWPTGSFSFVIDPGLAGEEKILATSRTGTTINITTRGYDNTSAASHVAGAIIYPVPTAIDFDEANALVSAIGTPGTGVGTFLQTPSSANLATAVTDETGSGSLVFGTSPTLSYPVINNFVLGYTTTATAAGTTTLTNTSNNQQIFTGSSTQTVVMPVASTMTVGTRYVIENNSTGNLTVNSSGSNLIATVIPGTSIKITNILTSGTTAASWDYEVIGFNTITGTGSAVFNASPLIKSPREITTVSATAATGTINFDANTQGTLYYTTSASANWTLNVRGDSSTTLNTVMATGDSLTITFLAAQGSTAYYASAFTIDGTSVTPKYQGGTAWTAGNASSTDAYTYVIFKTGSAAYTVFASQTKFA